MVALEPISKLKNDGAMDLTYASDRTSIAIFSMILLFVHGSNLFEQTVP